MNMTCGYISIVMSGQENFVLAGWFIIFAALFDTLDGFIARLANASSEFGVELDSLSDLVSFGAAPAFLVYKFGLEDFGNVYGVGISSLIMIGSALRLARFNVQLVGFDKEFFSGLPTPSQAITLSAFVIWAQTDNFFFAEHLNITIAALTIILSVLMVTKVKYDKFPKLSAEEFKQSPVKMSIYAIAFLLIIVFQAKAFFLAMLMYILFGLIKSMYFFFSEEDNLASQ
jgi:CDP-diacylglycerol--serine O-phosphatidyltransferase